MITLRLEAVGRLFEYLDGDTLGEVLLGCGQFDFDEFPGQRAADEHNAAIVLAGHGLAAGHESFWTYGETHSGSVRACAGKAVCENVGMSESNEWYWDLTKKMAVHADDRGPGDQTLGPYDSKAEAENWKATTESRNEAWDDADDDWNQSGDRGGSSDAK